MYPYIQRAVFDMLQGNDQRARLRWQLQCLQKYEGYLEMLGYVFDCLQMCHYPTR